MYSFAQRPDVLKVYDEPLYAYYLAQNPDLYRPYREKLLAADVDGAAVLQKLSSQHAGGTEKRNIVFVKHIAKLVEGLDISTAFGPNNIHFIMVRDPLDMMMSWTANIDVHREECSLETMGLPILVKLYSDIRKHSGKDPIVVDSNLLRDYPMDTLKSLSARLGIPYCKEQLSWTAGPKDIDGLWASHWYASVHESTGFSAFKGDSSAEPSAKKQRKDQALTTDQLALYREALPFYELLRRKVVLMDPLCPASSTPHVAMHIGEGGEEVTVTDHGLQMSASRLSDSRNESILAWVGDRLLPRELAKVSVFDSAVQGGDAVWEGMRVYKKRKVFKMNEHIQRLMDSSKAMAFKNIPTVEFIKTAIFKTLAANGMDDGVHIRLTLTRGAKLTSSMNPVFNVFGTVLIVLAEWKPVGDAATYDNLKGIKLITAAGRRNGPQCVDSKIHHCNLINNILPKIQANLAGAADALMLDSDGYVSETNACNVFMVKKGVVYTPTADYCLPGVTRQTVIDLCRGVIAGAALPIHLDLPMVERRVSLAEFHSADEVFTTGTMGELTPVNEIDGRPIGSPSTTGLFAPGPVFTQIAAAYRQLTLLEVEVVEES
jgi:branched-subunit amino acid aminotransferase/4-amino-4-deoxychorismate lyase